MMTARIAVPARRRTRFALVAALLALMLASATLGETKLDLNFVGADVATVLKAVADASGTNIVISPAVKGAINIKLNGVTVIDAIKTVTAQTGLRYEYRDGTYLINTKDEVTDGPKGFRVLALKALAIADAEAALKSAYPSLSLQRMASQVVLIGAEKDVDAGSAYLAGIDDEIAKAPGAGGSAQATYLVQELTAIAPADAEPALLLAYQDLKVKALPPNRLLLIGAEARLKEATNFLVALDKPGAVSLADKTVVFPLQTLTADDAMAVLSLSYKGVRTAALADKKRVAISGTPALVDQAATFLRTIDVPAQASGQDDTRTCKLTAVSSTDAVAALTLAVSDVRAQALPQNNLLLVGPAPRLNVAEAFLRRIDQAASGAEAFRVLSLTALSQQETVTALGVAFKEYRATPLTQNRVLIAGPATRMAELEQFIKGIDVAGPSTDAQIGYQIVTLTHRTVAEIEPPLAGSFPDVHAKGVPDGRWVVLTGAPAQLKAAADFLAKLDGVSQSAETIDLYTLRALSAQNAEEVLTTAYKDLRVKGLVGNRVVLVGASPLVAEAKAFLAKVDTTPEPLTPSPEGRVVVTTQYLSADDAKAALALTYKEVQVAALSNGQMVLSGSPQQVKDATAFLQGVDQPKSTAPATMVYAPARVTPVDAVTALGVAFPDVAAKPLANGQLILSGAPKQLVAAKALLASMDEQLPATAPASTYLFRPNAMAVEDLSQVMAATFPDVKFAALKDGQVLLTAPANRLDEAKSYLSTVDVARTQSSAGSPEDWVIVDLKVRKVDTIEKALAAAFRDVKLSPVSDSTVMLTGPKSRLDAAQALITRIDVASAMDPTSTDPSIVKMVDQTYRVKTRVPWQVKNFLEAQYGAQGLTVSFTPSLSWRTVPATPQTPAVAAPAANGATAPAPAAVSTPTATGATWQSDELLLHGPEPVVRAAMLYLLSIDKEEPFTEQRCSVQRVFASEAINYLLELYEQDGLTIITAPRSVVGPTGTAVNTAVGVRVVRGADKQLNVAEPIGDFMLRGPEEVVKQAVSTLRAMDQGETAVEKICTLRFLKAADTQKTLEASFGSKGLTVSLAPGRSAATPAGGEGGGGSTDMSAEINQIILRGPESVIAQAMARVTELDREPLQISIATEVVSVNSSEMKNLGVLWSGASGPGTASVNLNEADSGNALTLGRILRSPVQLSAALSALQSNSKARIVNRPSTVVQNGRPAKILVGDQVFYEVLTGVSATGPLYSTNSIETGVSLQVLPQASDDGVITLAITTTVSEPPTFRTGVSGAQLPSVRKNESSTVVKIRSGETLVIGGLMQTQDRITRSKVPFLGDIPGLGNLFRTTRKEPSQSELLILVRPSVLNPGDGATSLPAPPVAK